MDHDAPMEPAEVVNVMVEAAEKAGLHPAYVFAIRQCGFIATAENRHLLTDDQIEEWTAALDRWQQMHPDTQI